MLAGETNADTPVIEDGQWSESKLLVIHADFSLSAIYNDIGMVKVIFTIHNIEIH